jgi:subfamily B ATP-binding cassette protein MsbA
MRVSAQKVFIGFTRLNLFLRKVRARPGRLLIPATFALLASACEAVSIAALTPFMKGFLSQDYGFIRDWPAARRFLEILPEAQRGRDGVIFAMFVGIIVTAMLLKSAMSYVSNSSLAYQARCMNDHLRRALMERYLSFGKAYFDRTGSGQQLQVLMTHPVRILQTLMTINNSLSSVFLLIVYSVSIWMISWQLTLMVMFISPAVILSQHWLIAKIKKSSETDSQTRAGLNQKTVNILSGIPFVQSQCAEGREKELYAGLSLRQQQTEYSIDKKRYFVQPVQETVTLLILLIILGGMSLLMASNQINSVAHCMVYFFVLKRMMGNLQVFNHLRAELASVAAPIREVLDVLDDAGKPFVSQGPKVFGGLRTAIEFRGLSFSYDGARPVLDRVRMTLPQKGMTALVGPSGSGKSTVIQLLLRFYDCPPGTIFIDGTDIREFSLDSLRRHMAWVSQETHLFNQTLRENILFGLDRQVGEAEMRDVLKRSRLAAFVDSLPAGLDTLIGDRGVNLSGGEKQRVSIARAILKKSQILLLDEATSALDTVTEVEIQGALDELIAGRTAIVVAHRLSTIRNAQHVVYIENGVVIEEGTLDALLERRGKFYTAWQEQKFE